MSELQIITLNMILYIALFLVLCIKYKWDNLSVFLSAIYCFSAISSFLLFTFPLYKFTLSYNSTVSIEGICYLFVANFFIITAFRNFSLKNLKQIDYCSLKFLYRIQCFLIITFAIYIAFKLPSSISFFFSGNLADLRSSLYETNQRESFFLLGLISRLFGSTSILLLIIPAIKCFINRHLSRLDWISLTLYGLLKISIILGVISRATIIFSFLDILIVLLIFHSFLSRKVKHKLKTILIIVLPLTILIFSAISSSRFDDEKIGYLDLASLRYAGEAQLNFSALMYPDLKNPFHGFTQFSLFRRLVGMDYDDGLGRDFIYNRYIEQRYNYYNPLYVFHSLVGNWYANWGGILTMIIAVLFNIKMSSASKNNQRMSLMKIIVSLILASYVAKGIFFAEYQNESGNLLIIYLFFIYFYLKKYGRPYPLGYITLKKDECNKL